MTRQLIPPLLLAAACLALPAALGVSREPRWSDEVSYVSSAFKTARTGQLRAATHLPEDLLRHGTEHKPFHMPAYVLTLAAWLTAFPSPGSIAALNGLLFAAAALLLLRFCAGRSASLAERLLALAILLATPLGLAYAGTAMLESLALLVGTATFLSWRALRESPRGLFFLYATAALAFLTRETLLLLPAAAAVVDRRALLETHRRLLRERRAWALALGAFAALLAALAAAGFQGRAYHPNLLAQLAQAPGLREVSGLLAENLVRNAAAFGSWSSFPHDLLYGYGLLVFAATGLLALREGGGADGWALRVSAAFSGLSLLATCLLYDAFDWRGHRVLGICVWLGTAALLARIGAARLTRRLRLGALAAILALNAALALSVLLHFRALRTPPPRPHVLTALGLPEPGDLLFSQNDFQFLAENPRCELLWSLPEGREARLALVRGARPRFAILRPDLDLAPEGYQALARGDGTALWLRQP